MKTIVDYIINKVIMDDSVISIEVTLLLQGIRLLTVVEGKKILNGLEEIETVDIEKEIYKIREYIEIHGLYTFIPICVSLLADVSEDDTPLWMVKDVLGDLSILDGHTEWCKELFRDL